MATVNKIPVNGILPKSVVWNGHTVKQIWINVPNSEGADEKFLLYKNDEQFVFTTDMAILEGMKLAENTLIFKGFSTKDFKGNYISLTKDEEFPTGPKYQMVVRNKEGEN